MCLSVSLSVIRFNSNLCTYKEQVYRAQTKEESIANLGISVWGRYFSGSAVPVRVRWFNISDLKKSVVELHDT